MFYCCLSEKHAYRGCQSTNEPETSEGESSRTGKSRLMVHSVPTGQVVPTSGQVVDSTSECSGVSTTDFYQLTGSVHLKLLNDSCSTKLPLSRNPPLLEM